MNKLFSLPKNEVLFNELKISFKIHEFILSSQSYMHAKMENFREVRK